MRTLKELFENNEAWAEEMKRRAPKFFSDLASGQRPAYMWIGCSDSRVPANQLLGIPAGEVFVYRNVGNQVQPGDVSVEAAIYFAVSMLKVRHILVCGHYGCGGVRAALQEDAPGPLDAWLKPLRAVAVKYRERLHAIEDEESRFRRLCELNVVEQVRAVASLPIVREAWASGRALDIHGWMFKIDTGRLHDLSLCVTCPETVDPACDKLAL